MTTDQETLCSVDARGRLLFVTVQAGSDSVAERDAKKLEIYEDGIILRRLADNSPLQNARWQEIKDISWVSPLSAPNSCWNHIVPNIILFGIMLAGEIEAARHFDIGGHTTGLLIDFGNGEFSMVDNSYRNFQIVKNLLLKTSYQAWYVQTMEALDSGSLVNVGQVSLGKSGIVFHDTLVPWERTLDWSWTDRACGTFAIRWLETDKRRITTVFVELGNRGNVLQAVLSKMVEDIRHNRG